MPKMQKGSAFTPAIIAVVILLVVGVVVLKFFGDRSPGSVGKNLQKVKQSSCPDPFIFELPVDINKATSVLYPGQVRGGDYKAHGGFRFDTSHPNDIAVTAPYDAQVIAGARYPADTGEIQYTFDFAHPCGIRYRFGHLLTLTPKFQAIAEKFPLPKGLDSRTTEVYPPVEVKRGEVIATAVGLTRGGPSALGGLNIFVDWGVYDYRQKNEAAEDPDWAANHTSETYQYAVCWFDWISAEDKAKVLALPSSDYQSGKISDYCK
ncbi:hypothetical protein A2899_00795 [Candidatus Amesbacteria bacterium RIFCSPLOWO2_01_FULL_49_25]|uniref:Uncharacterized protein n=1 Tax=Candidatus Amesbacteria bacterium RIFCSPHIGHO2_01_FULL_48_32b TaxID=1797253 RepID=A0A1F4YCP8_9BACT|nr:MAG: hypothetical protein A2876_01450 [Candidatus Amesbacteria bacterium RIFCSPHIGHO2_01_FULL_48_32b]OGD08044.1 MAG: hypothetical protein A2899_00795 [Candidatus Amesbacteria bacterium RIFCSPLOWO2_01_FULL_49_25]